jgi:PAS domain S-box-containing protein
MLLYNFSETVMILAPFGRDADVAVAVLAEAGIDSQACADLDDMTARLAQGAGAAILTDDSLHNGDLTPLSQWLNAQPSWSDFPFIVLSGRERGPIHAAEAIRLNEALGNPTYLERPFHPTTLVSMVRSALRSRRRQYETRAHLAAIREAAERLDDEKNRLQAVLTNVPVGILFAETSGRIVSGNPQVERILRHPLLETETVSDHAEWVAYHPDGRRVEGAEYPLPRAMASGEPVEGEDYLYQRGDGTCGWIQLSAAPIRDRDGKVAAGVVSIVDIDRQKRTEEELRRSEAAVRENASQLEAIANSIDPIVWSARADGTMEYTSHRWTEFTGLPAANLSNEDWFGVIHPLDADEVRAKWRHAIAIGAAHLVEFRLRHKSGAYRWVLARALPQRDAAGAITKWYGTCTDIQEMVEAREILARSRAELEREVAERTEKLTATETRFRSLFEHLPSMALLIRVGPGEAITYEAVNGATEHFLGRDRGEMIGRDLKDIIPPESQAELSRRYREAAATGRIQRYEIALTLSGATKIAESVIVPVADGTAPDQGRMVLVSSREVTAERAIEDQLRQSQKMEAVGQLTGGIAHDFNNLLAGISGSIELVGLRIRQNRAAETERYLAAARSSVERAAALTHRLLAFSRRQTLDPKPVDVNALVHSVEDLLRRTIGPTIAFETDLANDAWPIFCDGNQLENALLNLAINARDAMPDGGRLFVETKNIALDAAYVATQQDVKAGEYTSILVTDSGTGMPPEVVARAFDPFFTTKPLGQGTGLGLSMVFGFVKQSGGHVRIYSEVGSGTTIGIYLPRYMGDGAVRETSANIGEIGRPGEGESVLIVDDEPTVRMLVTEALEELSYQVLEACDGRGGLDILRGERRVDLLITDVGLPGGMNGRQLADAARQLRPNLKVLFITGYAANAAVGNGLIEAGMEIMTKPFAIETLAGKVRAMMEGD